MTENSSSNVHLLYRTRNGAIGVRMEDYAHIESIPGSDITLAIICDGHGSLPYLLEEKGDDIWSNASITRFIGGYEVAQLATKTLVGYILHNENFPSSTFRKCTVKQMIDFLHKAFLHTQNVCIQEMNKGANSKDDLSLSQIDGYHFEDISQKQQLTSASSSFHKETITGKVLIPHPTKKGQHVLHYSTSEGGKLKVGDYGSTCTTLLFIAPKLYVANIGDSDCFLYRKQGEKYTTVRLTDDHSTRNTKEVQRVRKEGMGVYHNYFVLDDNGATSSTVGIMPSRGFGHALLSQHGIVADPCVTVVDVIQDDIVVLASDGLWMCFGGNEYYGANRVQEIIEQSLINWKLNMKQQQEKEQQPSRKLENDDKLARFITNEIRKGIPTHDNRDNIALIVLHNITSPQ